MDPERASSGIAPNDRDPRGLKGLCRWGGFAAFALLLYSLAMLVQAAVMGMGAPSDAAAVFAMLNENRIAGLFRLDLPTVFSIPLYYLLFLGLFAALHRRNLSTTVLSTALGFAGTTLVLATPTALPMLRLSELYAGATSDAARAQYLAAGEAIMATDIWHSTGAVVGGVLLQVGAVCICYVMLRGEVFSRKTAWLGLIMHGADLMHLLCGPFLPAAGIGLMAIAGVLYPFWFFLVGRGLLQLAAAGPALPNESLMPLH